MEQTNEEKLRIEKTVNALKKSQFKQQTLPAWRPVPSYISTSAIFIIFGIVFLTLGVVMYVMSDQIKQLEYEYGERCNGQDNISELGGTKCEFEIEIEEKIDGPLYVYYELGNFYQNHRRYVKSRSYTQLMGQELEMAKAEKECDPIVLNSDVAEGLKAWDKITVLDKDAVAYPCGLIAKSLFTDTYSISTIGTDPKVVEIDSSDIAWKSDVEFKFKNQEGDWEKKQWMDVTNQHFIVWMRTAGLPQFRKLFGVLKDGLPAGKYKLSIDNNYDVSSFSGSKALVFSTTNILGGRNYFLSIAYIVVGILCLILALIFFGVCLSKGRTSDKRKPQAN